jgi:glycosyltransferase involved in cell wall biosynthesis
MKVSIITATYNSERTIKDTLASVKQQTYKDVEHIIIDGDSKDRTIKLLDLYGHQGPVLSEADNGIYDAMNKGVAMADGDIVGILNSDDFYSDNKVIEKVVKAFEIFDCDAVYGDLVYIDCKQTNKIVRKWVAGNYDKKLFYKGWMPPHPTVFIKKEVYEKYGSFNLKFKSSSDYELLLRLMVLNNIKVRYIPHVLVHMRTGGQSTKSLSNRLAAHKEDYLAWLSNGISPKWYTLAMKPLSKLKQFRSDENARHSTEPVFKSFYPKQST